MTNFVLTLKMFRVYCSDMNKETKEVKWKLPTGFTTIPPEVRYSKRVSAGAKILYGDIKGLSFEKGYCSASNEYFAFCFQVDDKTISDWVGQLDDSGFIKRVINKRSLRKLYPLFGKIKEKNLTPDTPKADIPPSGKADTNKIIYNKIIDTIPVPGVFNSKEYFEYLVGSSKKFIQLIAVYSLRKKKYLTLSDKKQCDAFIYGRNIKVAKRLEGFSEKQILDAMKTCENIEIGGRKLDWSLETVEKQLSK